MSKTHYSAAELATLKLPGMPASARNMQELVRRENWPSRKRSGRGGGLEYLPPEPVRLAIMALQYPASSPVCSPASAPALGAAVVATTAALPIVTSATAMGVFTPTTSALTDRQRLVADARTGVRRAINDLRAESHCTLEAALTVLLVNARAGRLAPMLDRALKLARDGRGRKGDGYPSPRTLKRWLAADDAALAPRVRVKSFDVPSWAAAFLDAYQRPQKPSVQAAYRMAYGCEPLDSGTDTIPSIHQVRRLLEKVGSVSLATGRLLPRELKSLKPFVRRATEELLPDSIYTADGHTFDAEVAHPKHGRPFRPELTLVVSVGTRQAVGWSAGLAESTWAVLDAQRHAIEQHGIPAIWYVDNGSGYRNAMQKDDVVGFAARLGMTVMHSLPYNSQARGIIERAHQTIFVAAAKKLPTYMGAVMDREARQKVYKLTRSDIKTTGSSRHLLAWADFLAFIQAEIDAYNDRPHRSLPKFTDADGLRRHMSPNEAQAAAMDKGWSPTLLAASEIDSLFRPYTIATVIRAEIRLHGNLYFNKALEELHGEKVRVAYDIHNAEQVWVYTQEDGRFICRAGFEANKRRYVAVSVDEQATQRRADQRLARLEAHAEEVRAELAAPATIDQIPTLNVADFAAARERIEAREREAESARVIDLPVEPRRTLFDTDPEKYRWLIAHTDEWDSADAAWLLDYVAHDYAYLAERFEAFGQGWTNELDRLAKDMANEEMAAR